MITVTVSASVLNLFTIGVRSCWASRRCTPHSDNVIQLSSLTQLPASKDFGYAPDLRQKSSMKKSMSRRRCQVADFRSNGIGALGVTSLCEALKSNDTLSSLLLGTNSIGDEGAEILARYLAGARAIE